MAKLVAEANVKARKDCPYCGRSIFWASFWDFFSIFFGPSLVVDLPNGLIAHRDCHEKNQEVAG